MGMKKKILTLYYKNGLLVLSQLPHSNPRAHPLSLGSGLFESKKHEYRLLLVHKFFLSFPFLGCLHVLVQGDSASLRVDLNTDRGSTPWKG